MLFGASMENVKRKPAIRAAHKNKAAGLQNARHVSSKSRTLVPIPRNYTIGFTIGPCMRKDAAAVDHVKTGVVERQVFAVGQNQAIRPLALCPCRTPIAAINAGDIEAARRQDIDVDARSAADREQLRRILGV